MRGFAQAAVLAAVMLGSPPGLAQDATESLRAKAAQGDYEAQRDLASCLGEEPSECRSQPAPDPVQACKWRMVIVTSEHPSVSDGDVEAYRRDCGYQTISQLEQAAALAEAQRLFVEIYKRDMPVKLLLPVGR